MEDGRQRQHYIPNDQVSCVKRGVNQYNKLMRLVDRLTVINLKLMARPEDD
jgi:hypothetical protein